MRNPPGRRRRLSAIRSLLTLMLVLNVLTLIGAALVDVTGGIAAHFMVPLEVVYGPQPHVLRQDNLHLLPSAVDVHLRDPSGLQTLLGLLAHGLARAVAALPMIIFARRLVDRAVATNPFTMPMVRGLRRLGLIILVGGLLAELARTAAVITLYSTAVPGGPPFADSNYMIGFSWLVLGLVVLAFAQVVEHGCTLRGELDGLV